MVKDDFTAFLGSGTEYQGRLTFKGTVRVDCRFIGEIVSDGKLILGKEAFFEGTVTVKELVVHGVLTGEAVVGKRTVLHQDAKVTGTLNTPILVMEEGANLQGDLHMNKDLGLARMGDESAQFSVRPEHEGNISTETIKH
ncbi:MAG: polymer-forming cytoskeletal protein [Desulfovibrio sp.]|jgi:cytoskeletal protein CcmA (bactofilin family)|nr:polymer-forming cytoskeletal protein [Desulfovibrio sp.]